MTERRDGWQNVMTVAIAVCLVCSVLVSASAVLLKPRQAANITLDKQKNLLRAAGLFSPGDSPASIAAVMQRVEATVVDLDEARDVDDIDPASFDERAAARDPDTSVVVDAEDDIASIRRRGRYATVYRVMDGERLEQLILPVYGSGLYSMLYGFLALGPDLQTIVGIKFYEQGETAGLGARIDSLKWLAQWGGKRALDTSGRPIILVVKGGVFPGDPDATHKVDAISGATITSTSVQDLLHFWLGDNGFGPYLNSLRRQLTEDT
ncbi:MAG: Na(+)-translocating NADH-quinone reductase subunit C [Gammaproteobacteria bacterium]